MEKVFILSFQLISDVDNSFVRKTENLKKIINKMRKEKREIKHTLYTIFSATT